MKKFISKIRNKRLKGNVSLLVIFVLLASSVIALLSINQIQHLLAYWNMTFNYFRAFYLAKAWTELGLTEVYYREAWFEDSVGSWDAIVTWNLIPLYSGFNPYFTMDISWSFLHLTDDVRYTDKCDGDNRITLGTWEWIVLSLFFDKTEWLDKILTWTKQNEINNNIKEWPDFRISELQIENIKKDWGFQHFTFWLFDYGDNWDMDKIYVKTWDENSLNDFLENINNMTESKRRYLTIKNPGTNNETVSFCITTNSHNQLIPYSDSLIRVRWNYDNMEVWLQSVVKKTTPSWSLNVLE